MNVLLNHTPHHLSKPVELLDITKRSVEYFVFPVSLRVCIFFNFDFGQNNQIGLHTQRGLRGTTSNTTTARKGDTDVAEPPDDRPPFGERPPSSHRHRFQGTDQLLVTETTPSSHKRPRSRARQSSGERKPSKERLS